MIIASHLSRFASTRRCASSLASVQASTRETDHSDSMSRSNSVHASRCAYAVELRVRRLDSHSWRDCEPHRAPSGSSASSTSARQPSESGREISTGVASADTSMGTSPARRLSSDALPIEF
eukprot:7389254-Prymnesium_polylepis.1